MILAVERWEVFLKLILLSCGFLEPRRCFRVLNTKTEANLVVIIKSVSFFVGRHTQRVMTQSLASTYWCIDLSINRQINSEIRIRG